MSRPVRTVEEVAWASGLDLGKAKEVAERHGAEFLVAYGSFVRGDEQEGSDLDLACGCGPGSAAAFGEELSRACAVPVDLRPFGSGSPAWRAEVALTGVCIYEREQGRWEAARAAALAEWARRRPRGRERGTVPHEAIKARFG
ncbi:MAG: nucleotidyltransferase domain-containing protein [Bacillota bacterium]